MILECTVGFLVNKEMVVSFEYNKVPVTLFIRNPRKHLTREYITKQNTQIVKYLRGRGKKRNIDLPVWIFCLLGYGYLND